MNDSGRDPGALSDLGRLKFVAKDTAIYGAAATLAKSVGLITFPLLARHFSVEEYGLVDLFTLLTGLLTTLVIMGQESAVVRFYYDQEDDVGRRNLITQSITLQLSVAAVALPLLWVVKEILAVWLGYGAEIRRLLDVVLLTVPFSVILGNAQAVLRFTFRRRPFLVLSIGRVAAVMVAVVIGTTLLDVGLVSLFWLYLLVSGVFGVLALWFIRQWLTRPFGQLLPRKVIYYAVPMGLIVLIGGGQPFIERIVTIEVLGDQGLGVYAAGAKIALLMSLPIGAFQTAFGPFLMATHNSPGAMRTFNLLLKVFLVLLSLAVVVLAGVGGPLIRALAGERYVAGAVVVFPLAMGLYFQAVGLFLGMGTILSHKTHYRLASFAASLAIGIVAMVIFGSAMGLVGVAIGAAIGQGMKLIFESIIGQRLWPMAWEYGGVPVLMVVTVLLGYGLSQIELGPLGRAGSLLAAVGVVVTAGWIVAKDEDRGLARGIISGFRFGN